MTELCFLTIAEASQLLASRKLSPVELTAAYLDRIERLDPQLNSYLLVLADEAMASARAAEADIMQGKYRGPLHGIPISLKDIYCTEGARTTGHSALMQHYIPDEDAHAVALCRQAGAIMLGKNATWEFAVGGTSFDLPWPPARNPWNTELDPGGSSSGSAVGVAAGLAMAALGTDTGGSIRSPSALCGLAGIKPTYGLVGRRGILPLAFSLDHGGPMCWTVEDCALMMGVLAGHDPRDPTSADVVLPDFGSITSPVRGLRIGYARKMTEEAGSTPSVIAALERALDVLKSLGATVVEVELAAATEYADVGSTISRSEAYAIYGEDLVKTPELFGRIFRQRIMPGAFVRACDYVNALRDRTRLVQQLATVMNDVDLIVMPSVPAEAHPLGKGLAMMRAKPSLTRLFNVTGSPALSVCTGFGAADLPVSMQIIGRPFEDHVVLRAGYAFEAATNFRKRRPKLEAGVAVAAE